MNTASKLVSSVCVGRKDCIGKRAVHPIHCILDQLHIFMEIIGDGQMTMPRFVHAVVNAELMIRVPRSGKRSTHIAGGLQSHSQLVGTLPKMRYAAEGFCSR